MYLIAHFCWSELQAFWQILIHVLIETTTDSHAKCHKNVTTELADLTQNTL